MLKKLKYITLLSLIVLIAAAGDIIAQAQADTDLGSLLEDYCASLPYEDMYIHSDREIFVAGEDMWFCSYLFDRHSGKIASKNSIAYFELLNPYNQPVIQKRLLVSQGICPGNIHLPDTLSSGVYTCRIYTNWMKNFLPDNACMKDIKIINPFREKSFRGKSVFTDRQPLKVNMKFSPEGRTLMSGIHSKIAVRVTDDLQRGIPVSAVVRNNRGDSVAAFSTTPAGLGSFELTPAAGARYYVLYKDNITYLPLPADEGCAMRTEHIGRENIAITITENGSSYSSDNREYTLLIHSGGNTGYSEHFSIPGLSRTIIVPKRILREGVNQITLFNENMNPVCERLIHTGLSDKVIAISVQMSDNYQRREKVTLDIALASHAGEESRVSDLSVSVIPAEYSSRDMGMETFMDFGTGFGYLPWQSSGYSPGDDEIDNFLIGARSNWIKWGDVTGRTRPETVYQMEEDLHFLNGTLKAREGAALREPRALTISVPGRVAAFFHTISDPDGNFSFKLPVDRVQRNLIIQPGAGEENISVEMMPSFSAKLPGSLNFADSLTSSASKLFSDIGARYQLNKIFDAKLKEEPVQELAGSLFSNRFYGKPETELIMADYIRLPVMQEVFFELTPGIRLRERRSEYEFRIINPVEGTWYEDPPTVMIDGVIINDMSVLAALDPEIVERIDITRSPYLTGNYVHSAIIHVITIPGKYRNITLPDNAVSLPYRITEPVALFSGADYPSAARKDSRIPDFRNTLYWNPSLNSGSEGRIKVEFWTSDLAGDYVIEICGRRPDGKPVSVTKTISVD